MPYKRRNPVNWQRQGYWFEAEGSKREAPTIGAIGHLDTVTQTLDRKDVVKYLCRELVKGGFTAKIRLKKKENAVVCSIDRIEEQICFIKRTKPYYLSKETKEWAERYLAELERRRKKAKEVGGRPRIPFECP